MLTFGADVRFGGLDQILQPSIWGGGQSSVFAQEIAGEILSRWDDLAA
jgi:hypothetical protein